MTNSESEPLSYWLVNVPQSELPLSCPDYLLNATNKDKANLSIPDQRYRPQAWAEVKEIIRTNRIDRFQRVPSQLRRYLEYTATLKQQYGSIVNFVVKERLKWGDQLDPRGLPFQYDDDITILYNDWPYGVEAGIVHLVAWTKFALEDDPATDDLTLGARREIDSYVERKFRIRMPADQVIWFRSWRSLKSVYAVEHFHIMLNHPDMDFIREITNNDVPLVMRIC